ncbi:hypothetical protein H1R20_g3975, partial [Candolleomyces eurysporus]
MLTGSRTFFQELQRILSRSLEFLYSGTDSLSGLQTQCDYLLVIKTFEAQLDTWSQQWFDDRLLPSENSPTVEYKRMMRRFYFNYAMLVLNSFGLQNALERAHMNIPHFFARCHTTAMTCATIVRDTLGPSGFLRYSPDSHFVQISYAILTLLKLIRPEFQAFLDNEQNTLQLVKDVADILDNVAANNLHTPALYSGFLRALISAKLESKSASLDGSGSDTKTPPEEISGITHLEMQPATGFHPPPPPPQHHHQQQQSHAGQVMEGSYNLLSEFQFDAEMGPVADMSTFPPTMAPPPPDDANAGLMMENILSSGFWDSMLIPGYNSVDGFSGGFVFGTGGSGLITPRFGISPEQSGANTPGRHGLYHQQGSQLTQHSINAAFNKNQTLKDGGIKIDVSSS